MGLGPDTYKFMHLTSVITVFSSLAFLNGKIMAGGVAKDAPQKFVTAVCHIALVVAIFSGFGLFAVRAYPTFPGWVIIKAVLAVCAFMLVLLLNKKPEMKLWFFATSLGFAAIMVSLAVFKPF